MIIQPTAEQTRRVTRSRTYSGPGFGPSSFQCLGIGLGLGLGRGIVSSGGGSQSLDVADLAFRLDASNPACYTQSGGTLTSLTSLVSGTPLTTVTGAPKFRTDPRTNQPAFFSDGTGAVRGADATMAAAATGTNRAFTVVSVVQVTACTSTGYWFCANNSTNTHGLYTGQVTPGFRLAQGGPGGFISATSEKCIAGRAILVQHSADGLTVKSRLYGFAESSVTVASHGLMTPDRVGIFETVGLTPGTRFPGWIFEQLFYGVDKTDGQIDSILSYLAAKWRPAPVAQFVGDSITTAQLANNGGMVALVVAAARADGLNIDPQGPIAQANGAGGAVYEPYRYSAASGDTCAQMQARIAANTTGLGVGGGSEGFYRRTRLVCLHAGTNDRSIPDYTALLGEIGARLATHGPTWKIAVTTIPEITGSEASVASFNASLPAVWDAFEATYPGTLLRWDCYACAPSRSDGTHPNDAGYVSMVSNPTNGLYQAIKPYLQSIQ